MATSPLAPTMSRPAAPVAIITVIAGCITLAVVSVIVPLSVLGQIGNSLHATGAVLNWVVIASSVMGALASGIFPPLASIFGQRTMLTASMATLTVGAVMDALAPNMVVFLAGRFICALGVGVIALSLAILRTNLSGGALGFALGCVAAAEGLGSGLGFVFGGLITETIDMDWRTVFWLLAALGALAVGVAALAVPQARDRAVQRVDWLGGFLLGGALIFLLVPLSQGPNWGWNSPSVLVMLVVGVLLTVAWWLVEDRSAAPMVNTRALRDRNFILGWTVYFTTAMLVWIINFSIPVFASAPASTGFGLGYGPLLAGLVMVPLEVGIVVAGMAAGALERWVSPRALCLIAFGCAVLCMMLLAVAHSHPWQLWTWPAIFGVSYGFGVAGAYQTFIRALRPDQAATAAGIGQSAGNMGSAVAGAAITAILTAQVITIATTTVPTEHSFELGWWLGAGLAALGGIAALALKTPQQPHKTTPAATPPH